MDQGNGQQDTSKIFTGTEAAFVQNGYHRYGGGGGRGSNWFAVGNLWDDWNTYQNEGRLNAESGANLFGGGGGAGGPMVRYQNQATSSNGASGGSGCIIIRFRFPRDSQINWSQNGASI